MERNDVAASASYSTTLRVELPNEPGALARVLTAIAQTRGMLGAIDIVRMHKDVSVRDVTVNARDAEHVSEIRAAVEALPSVHVINVSDRTFLLHLGGKVEVRSKIPLRTRDDLSMAYTPGVARVSNAIMEDREASFNLTIRANTVAVVSDGTAVLGLGDIGAEAALPVMEGKAALFKEFADVNAFPICLGTKDPDEIVSAVKSLAPTFGGINLEDISAPRCFVIEEQLKTELDIPVFHDDQHGTAVVVLAALQNAVQIVGKTIESLKVVILGTGAAGIACAKILLASRVGNIIGVDRRGVIHRNRKDLEGSKRWLAENGNPEGLTGGLREALSGADLLLGVSGPGLVNPEDVDVMAKAPIIFAMANPIPEVMPEHIAGRVGVMATGRSDYPNQINNVLCFPGVFKGALECRAREINEEMKLRAARALAEIIPSDSLTSDYIIPSVFDERVVPAVAEAVIAAAHETGVARRAPSRD